jgi:hypothetical protein
LGTFQDNLAHSGPVTSVDVLGPLPNDDEIKERIVTISEGQIMVWTVHV